MSAGFRYSGTHRRPDDRAETRSCPPPVTATGSDEGCAGQAASDSQSAGFELALVPGLKLPLLTPPLISSVLIA